MLLKRRHADECESSWDETKRIVSTFKVSADKAEFSQSLMAPHFHPEHSDVNVQVTQSCPTLCGPVDCSLPGSSVHGILQARILEWVAASFSRGSSQLRDGTQVSHIASTLTTCKGRDGGRAVTFCCQALMPLPWHSHSLASGTLIPGICSEPCG